MKILAILIAILCISFIGMAQNRTVTVTVSGGIQDQSVKRKIETNASLILTAINNAYIDKAAKLMIDDKIITSEAYRKLNDIWRELPFYCQSSKITDNVLISSQTYQFRNIPISDGKDLHYLVIIYLSDGVIDDVYFGLPIHQYKNVMNPNSVVDKTRREIILNFVENFRTAYIRKDIDFIEKVFSDQALIITGKVVQQSSSYGEHISSTLSPKEIEYQKLTKKEYIERLRTLFSKIGYLNLEFNDIEVNIHDKYPNFYGVLLEQYWITSNYKDVGYLFLLVQFRDDDYPLIWVRTWQDASQISEEDIFGFHNFKILD
jgi:hypothetical protein